ncbi:MAG: protein kinase, partial [Nanoarchaeota archaeon]|nr:protein kinase [Nanoarchaeota archaeon]
MVTTFRLNMPTIFITSVSDSGRYYALEKKVGSGAHGEVFQGYDIDRPNVMVAVKYAKSLPNQSAMNGANSRIMREGGFLMNIHDPRVVRYKDVCTQHKP